MMELSIDDLNELERLIQTHVDTLRTYGPILETGNQLIQTMERHGGEYAILLYLINKTRELDAALNELEVSIENPAESLTK